MCLPTVTSYTHLEMAATAGTLQKGGAFVLGHRLLGSAQYLLMAHGLQKGQGLVASCKLPEWPPFGFNERLLSLHRLSQQLSAGASAGESPC